jgi:hypothetical protein
MKVPKRSYDRSVPKTISMPEVMLDAAQDKARRLGYPGFSDYIQMLIRRDNSPGPHIDKEAA